MEKTNHRVAKYDSVEASQKAGGKGKSLCKVSLLMWRPLLVVAMFWILQFERSDLTAAFIRTMISCPQPVPQNGKCPKGTSLASGACVARPPGSHDWSGSAVCADQFTVVAQGTAIGGRISSICGVCSLFAAVFIGSTMIDLVGRRPVMLLALLGSCVCTAFFFVADFTSTSVSIALLFVGAIQFALLNVFEIATKAMTADLSRNDVIQRGIGYIAVNIAVHVGILVAFACGFFILALDLTDYTLVWAVFLAICVAFSMVSYVLLPETLHHSGDGEADALASDAVEAAAPHSHGAKSAEPPRKRGGSCLPLVSAELISCFRMVCGDAFLITVMFLSLLTNIASSGAISITGGYSLYVVGLTQAVGSLAGVFNPAAILCGSSMAPVILNAVGAYASYLLGLLIAIGGMIIVGLAAVFRARAEALFWLGFITLGVGWGIKNPSLMAIVSIRSPNAGDQGKLFAALHFTSCIGYTIGTYVWSNLIFKHETAVSWVGGLGYFVSTAIYVVVFVGYLALFVSSRRSTGACPFEVRHNPQK